MCIYLGHVVFVNKSFWKNSSSNSTANADASPNMLLGQVEILVVGVGQSAGIGQMEEQEKSIRCNQIVVPYPVRWELQYYKTTEKDNGSMYYLVNTMRSKCSRRHFRLQMFKLKCVFLLFKFHWNRIHKTQLKEIIMGLSDGLVRNRRQPFSELLFPNCMAPYDALMLQ